MEHLKRYDTNRLADYLKVSVRTARRYKNTYKDDSKVKFKYARIKIKELENNFNPDLINYEREMLAIIRQNDRMLRERFRKDINNDIFDKQYIDSSLNRHEQFDEYVKGHINGYWYYY